MNQAKLVDLMRNDPLWQDRDLRFDASIKELQARCGEKCLYSWDKIEDTKGNSGDEGRLSITTLRIIWQSKSKPRINLTIGLNCVISLTSRNLHNKLRGRCNALHIMCKCNGTRYEFIFTPLDQDESTANDPIYSKGIQITQQVSRICKAYFSTKLFRDLKLRSAIFTPQGKQLKILAGEQIYNKFQGVWNLSSDQGNLGTMHVTNLRIIWHANVNELFNLSLPYIQVSGIKVRESKFGPALVIESSESSGAYVLGFRIDPPQRLNSVFSELCNLYNVHITNPNYGVEAYLGLESSLASGSTDNVLTYGANLGTSNVIGTLSDESDYVERNRENNPDIIASYLEDDGQNIGNDSKPVYCPKLGLAIEKIKDGFTLESLWNVIPSD